MAKTAGLGPKSWQKGGGLLNDADGIIKEARYVMWDYNGNTPEQVAARLTIEQEDAEDVIQYLSCGQKFDGTPSDDGKTVDLNGKSTGFNENCAWIEFLKSCVEAGFPQEKLEESDDISLLEGMNAHFMRVPIKRKGLAATRTDAQGNERPIEQFVVDKIHKLPWDNKTGKGGAGKGKGAGAAKGNDGENNDGDVEDLAISGIEELLAANPKGMDKKKLGSDLFNKFKTHPRRNDILKLARDDEWLGNIPNWNYDGSKVTA